MRGKHGAEPPLGDVHFGLGLGPPHTNTSNDDSLPDSVQAWVWAESCLVRGFSPTQGRQGSRVLVGFPVNGVFFTYVSELSDSTNRETLHHSFFVCRSHCFLDEAEIQLFFSQQ